MSQVFYFKAKHGIIEWSNKGALHAYLLDHEGINMFANMDKVKSIRSLDQNAYMWFYLEVIARETGNIADDLHRLFKGLFLPKRCITLRGKEYTLAGSTTELSKGEMSVYLDKISAHTGVPLPDPKKANEVGFRL